MNKSLRLDCDEVMDKIYESSGDDLVPLLQKLRISFHLFFCVRCSEKMRKLEMIKEIPQSQLFPPSPSFEEIVMDRLAGDFLEDELRGTEAPGAFSFRSWVIIGFIILISLATSFFGIDIIRVAFGQDSSYLIPLGITVGIVLTGYGAFFIASNLEELREHFKIH